MDKIAHFNTLKEAYAAIITSHGYICEKAFGGWYISKHEQDCTCGKCPVLSTVGTWI